MAKVTQLRLPLFRPARCRDCGGPLVSGEGGVSCAVCGHARAA